MDDYLAEVSLDNSDWRFVVACPTYHDGLRAAKTAAYEMKADLAREVWYRCRHRLDRVVLTNFRTREPKPPKPEPPKPPAPPPGYFVPDAREQQIHLDRLREPLRHVRPRRRLGKRIEDPDPLWENIFRIAEDG